MKLLATSLLLLTTLTLHAAENSNEPAKAPEVWKVQISSEDREGQKTQTVFSFMPLDPASAPVTFGAYSGRLDLKPWSHSNGRFFAVQLDLWASADGVTTDGKPTRPIYSAVIPVEFSKDIQLLKSPDATLTLRLTNPAEKE